MEQRFELDDRDIRLAIIAWVTEPQKDKLPPDSTMTVHLTAHAGSSDPRESSNGYVTASVLIK